jgi:C-terminal processing protease CtpA/Prc
MRTTIRSITPRPPDSTRQAARPPRPPAPRPTTPIKPRIGYLEIDSTGRYAYLRVNTFSGKGVSKLIRQSFETIEAKNISQLIVDIRDNGGGRITKSALLGRYLANEPFKAGDSISAKTLKMPYPKYVQAHAFYQLFGWMIVKRKSDGRLHFGSMERKVYKPKKANHFDGNLYVLTSGRSFSASILFLQHIANRPNKMIVGEETGGTARGNSAVMTPDITLPNTHIRARLPLFRLITRASLPQNGRGVLPDILIPPNSSDIRYRKDAVLEAVKQKIAERK